ncbi:MAG: YhdP family protein [Arsenophonus sp. ER-QC15-MAG3]
MKRLVPKALVTISIVIIFIIALSIIGFRFFLYQINEYRDQLEEQLQILTGMPFKINRIESEMITFWPKITLSDFSVNTEKIYINIKKVKLSLDIWRSLSSLNIYFQDIMFYQLNVIYNKPLKFISQNNFINFHLNILNKLFLKQFYYFKLKEGRITFLTQSAEKITLNIHELILLNENSYHQAQVFLNFDSLQQRNKNEIQIKLNLYKKNDVIDQGKVYLEANDINLLPWLSCWLRDITGLKNTTFNLSSWITIKNGHIENGRLHINHGRVNWKVDKQDHELSVNDLLLEMNYKENGWFFNIAHLQHLKTDQKQWIEGQISIFYLPKLKINEDYWHIRVNNIQLERIKSILPIFSFFMPELINDWKKLQLKGRIITLELDIFPRKLEKTVIDVSWEDISWIYCKGLPSVNHFSGTLRGNQKKWILSFNLNNSLIEYPEMFKAPLEISYWQGKIFYLEEEESYKIWSENMEVQAKSLWIIGDFHYLIQKNKPSTLTILGGAKLINACDAWRYFPIKLMGKDLSDYLTRAIIAGHIDEATMVFHGNPIDFPFKKNNGQFQIFVPLRGAIFKYQHNWPTIFNLDIDLNFERNALWMSAPSVKLGDAKMLNLNAYISDYSKSKLLIKSNIISDGKAIGNFFKKIVMDNPIGKILDTVKIGGNIAGKLILDIPLKESSNNMITSGHIDFNNNDLNITLINSKLKHLTGRFYFRNSDFKTEKLQAQWFDQPVNLTLNTINKRQNYSMNIKLSGNWKIKKISNLPKSIIHNLAGSTSWKGQVNIQLPNQLRKNITLSIAISGKLNNIISEFPALNTKKLKQLDNIQIRANGDTCQLKIYGDVGHKIRFNGQWQFSSKKNRLLKINIQPYKEKNIILQKNPLIIINLPEISDLKWFSLLDSFFSSNILTKNYSKSILIPNIIIINLEKITFAKQQWNKIVFTIEKNNELTKIVVDSDKLNGSLIIPKQNNWQVKINYLYFNPEILSQKQNYEETKDISQKYNISNWPNIDIYCLKCLIVNHNFNELRAQIIRNKQTLILKNGSLMEGDTNLKIFAIWHANKRNSTVIKGVLKGNQFNDLASYYGILTPIKEALFKIDFDLNLSTMPFKPDIGSLNGNLRFNLEKGRIAHMGGGRSGQFLQFISFDVLLRKLQLDFSDTFNNDFIFDSIRGDATIKNGILNINNFYLDGLIADITVNGKIDLVHRNMNIEAIITPEISAPVSVATAIVINPFVGAAVFAVTKALRPLWSKISVIRYRIIGSFDQPKVNEIFHKLNENQKNY